MQTQITPENIDTYADDALAGVIGLIDDAVHAYRLESEEVHESGREWENAAFNYFGLNDVESVLNHFHEVSTELTSIDGLISGAIPTDDVLVPPSPNSRGPSTGETSDNEEMSSVSRLKTVLYTVAHFQGGIDIHDETQVRLTSGSVTDAMQRELPYTLVDIPACNRAVLVCDEMNNITYVFDTKVMSLVDHSLQEIARLSKPKIDELLQENPDLGQRVVYSSHAYIGRLELALLTQPHFKHDLIDRVAYDIVTKYGYSRDDISRLPHAPEGYVNVNRAAFIFDVHPATISGLMQKISNELGGVIIARKGESGIERALSPLQQYILMEHLREGGFLPINYRRPGW